MFFVYIDVCVYAVLQIRENLLSKQQSIERSEKAKKLRAMRKFGKQVRLYSLFLPQDAVHSTRCAVTCCLSVRLSSVMI